MCLYVPDTSMYLGPSVFEVVWTGCECESNEPDRVLSLVLCALVNAKGRREYDGLVRTHANVCQHEADTIT